MGISERRSVCVCACAGFLQRHVIKLNAVGVVVNVRVPDCLSPHVSIVTNGRAEIDSASFSCGHLYLLLTVQGC